MNPPCVQDFVWKGGVEAAEFTVECLPNAAVGVALCLAHIIQGSNVTRLSFGVEVVETEDKWKYQSEEARLLDTQMEQAEANVAVIDPNELEITNVVIGHGNQVGMGVATKEADFSFFPPFLCVRACACVRISRLVAPAMEEVVLTRLTQHRAEAPCLNEIVGSPRMNRAGAASNGNGYRTVPSACLQAAS